MSGPDTTGWNDSAGRTLKKETDDVLAYFDRPGTSPDFYCGARRARGRKRSRR